MVTSGHKFLIRALNTWENPLTSASVVQLLICTIMTTGVIRNKVQNKGHNSIEMNSPGTSLVAQWLRICLPMQETRVRALVREDTICHRATKPVHHNY